MTRSIHRQRRILAGVASTALVVSGLSAAATTAQATDQPSAEPAQIQDAVLSDLAKDGEATFWVRFDSRPDMSQFSQISDWDARGTAVYDALTSTADAAQADVRADLDAQGLTYTAHWATNAIFVEGADKEVVNELARSAGVEGIYGTTKYEIPVSEPAESTVAPNAAEWGVRDINADDVWGQGVTGEGIVIGNIDTGVQYDHPALVNQYRGNNGDGTFTHDYNWFDAQGTSPSEPSDGDGHGTHTMGTMVGDDGSGNQIGVAPGATWIAANGCCPTDEALINSGEWMLAPTKLDGTSPDPAQRPNIINNSWGTTVPDNDPFMEDVIAAWDAAGIFSVWSNGNNGPGCNTSGSPGSRVITYSVGSYDSFHSISGFSSRGTGQDGEIKPNISAPGGNVRSSVPGGGYGTMSGTSMAAPHVAGAIALLWSNDAALAGDIAATRALLDGTAVDSEDLQCGGTAEDNNVFGEGRLDAYALIFGDAPPEQAPAITVDPASIEGSQAPDATTEHTLTVGNTGTADLDYTITEVAAGGAGSPVLPQGTDRAHAGAEAAGQGTAPAVVEPAAVPAVASLTEGFDDISTLPGSGWAIKNNSEPVGGTSWFQGSGAEVFPSHEGAPDAYVGANYNNAGGPPGNISNWLMTPEVDLVNGAEFSFWTRTSDNPAQWVDRLEVRLSTSGDSTNVGTGYDGVGDFDTLLLSVNPDLTTTGYPAEWTQYTATIEGLEAQTTGRIGFHYWVPDGGTAGVNSNYIGVDTVSYEADVEPPPPACEVVDAPWLSVDPASGTVAAGGSADVTVTLDSAGLAAGDYTAALCVESNDPANPVVNVPVTLTVTDGGPVDPATVQRIYGADRYATAGEISAEFPDGVDTVYIANGTEVADGADALAAGAAGARGALGYIPDVTPDGDPAPILLVKPNQIPGATAAALAALAPSEIIIVGGTNSVSAGVEEELGESGDVRRISGGDRYKTAALIAAEYGTADTVYVATGQGNMDSGLALADALSASSVAGSQGAPVVLTRSGSLPAATAAVITELDPANIVVVGGSAAVSDAVLAELNALAPTERVAGSNRYKTAVALTADYAADGDMLFIASGTAFPDALTGSSLTGSQNAPLLLTKGDDLPNAVAAEILRLSPQGITIFGGSAAVDEAVEAELQELLDTTSTD